MKVIVIYEDVPYSDRKWLRIIKTDEGRTISRTRHYTKEAAEHGEQPGEDAMEDGMA